MKHISNQNGFVLVLGLILMAVLTTVALGSIAVSLTDMLVSSNYRSSVQAVTLAEGGLAQVIYWFNNPATFTDTAGTYHASTPNPSERGPNFFAMRRGGQFFSANRLSQFYDVDGNGTGDTGSACPPQGTACPALRYDKSITAQKTFLDNILTTAGISAAGNITNITIFGSTNTEEVARVQVTAQSKAGGTSTIEAVLGPTPGSSVANGLEVGGSGAFAGKSAKVHWSNALIVGNVDLGTLVSYDPPQLTCGTAASDQPNNKLYGTGGGHRVHDPWLVVRVGGTVATAGGAAWPTGCRKTDGYDYDTAPSLVTQCDPPEHNNIAPGLNNDAISTNNVILSKISYDVAKVFAKKSKFYKGSTAYDSYYYTKPGTSEKNNIYDAAGTQYNFRNRIDGITRGIIFVDTTDQKIPNAYPMGDPSSNLQELSLSGGFFFTGTMILAANPKISGLGSGTNITVQSPPWNATAPACTAYPLMSCSSGTSTPMCATAAADRITVSDVPIHLRGLIYVFGTMDITGNLQIFGALVTERGFAGAGTPEVWFDFNLRGGNPNVSPVFIRFWREVGST